MKRVTERRGETRVRARGNAGAGSWIDGRRFADVAGVLGWGPRVAAYRSRDAVLMVEQFPSLVDALADGEIDLERLTAVATACRDIPQHRVGGMAPTIEHAMLDGARGGIGAWTATTTRKRARAAVAAVDALAPARHRARSAREAVGVTFAPGSVSGTSVLTATLSTEQAATVKAAIDQLAWQYQTGKATPADRRGRVGRDTAGSGRQACVEPRRWSI